MAKSLQVLALIVAFALGSAGAALAAWAGSTNCEYNASDTGWTYFWVDNAGDAHGYTDQQECLNDMYGRKTETPSVGGGKTDPYAALGSLLGTLLYEALSSSEADEPKKESSPKKPQRLCAGGWCYPKGDPSRFANGSREQFEAVCAMSNAENNTRYLNYPDVATCADRMMEIMAMNSTGAYTPKYFSASEPPAESELFRGIVIEEDGSSRSASTMAPKTSQPDAGGSCTPIDDRGAPCITATELEPEDRHGWVYFGYRVSNSCNSIIFVGARQLGGNGQKFGTYLDPGETEDLTCYYIRETGGGCTGAEYVGPSCH